MRVETYPWTSGQPLTDDYIARSGTAAALFEFDPWTPGGWEERASWLDQASTGGADRSALVEVLLAFNRRAGNAPQALESAELLRDPRTLCVVGGQQAGLFSGPLLVIYKALTIITAARQASRDLNRPVVPVFWIAGEDHDFDEVNHVDYLSAELQVERIKLEHPGGARTSVSRTDIPADVWGEAIRRLDESLVPTEFKEEILAVVRSAVGDEAGSLTGQFARLLADLFGSHGLILMDSDDPALRRLEAPMFRTLIERSGDIGSALRQSTELLQSSGYKPQVELSPQGANLFVFTESGERTALYRTEEGGFADRRGDRRFSQEELLRLADASPERLSNNVMTRPLMQEYLLPVLAVVLGPAEIAYWGMTREAFRLLGMRMPLLLPRQGFTLVEGTTAKHMHKFGLSFEDVTVRMEEKRQAWLQEQDELGLADRFAVVKEQFRAAYEPLIEAVGGINPGLRKLGDTNLAKILEQIDFLEHKAGDGLRTQHESGLRQLQRIELSLYPGGRHQERVYNVYAYLNRFGRGWLQELSGMELPLDGQHRIVYL